MPLQKPYDHAIDFEEGAKLPKPAKVYPLSLAERNSLDSWIDEELRKGYIRPSTSCNDKPSRDDRLITLNVMRERRELDGVSW